MRICHLIASNFAGGPEKQIVELTTRLVEFGWEVRIGSFREGRSEVEIISRAQARGLETFLIDTRSPFSPAAVLQLRRQLRDFGAEILLTHGYKADTVGRLGVRGTGVRQIPVVRGFTGEDRKIRLYEALDRRILKSASALVSVSEATKRMLVDHGVRAERVHVVHNSVDCLLQPTSVDLHDLFSLPAGAPVVVAAGRLSPEKGHRFLVEALAICQEACPQAQLVLLGDGKLRGALEEQATALGLSDRVHLAGFRQDVLECLAAADLVVNPSLTEGLPNVVLEAMSVGTAVAATDVGGVAELIPDPDRGWLVEAGRPEALAAAMVEALSSDEERRRRAAGGRAHVREHFSFEVQRRRFCELCEQLAADAC